MSRINSRVKGATGEREFAKWLKDNLDLVELPTRNLEQVRKGGADIMDVPPFVFEVKRCETLQKKKWWIKLLTDCKNAWDVPVVAYRKNRQPWRFLISAMELGLSVGYIQLEEHEFKLWLNKRYSELNQVEINNNNNS